MNLNKISAANSLTNPELDKIKVEFFGLVESTFTPRERRQGIFHYDFYVDNKHWLFIYDTPVKFWTFVFDDKIVLTRFDKDSEYASCYIKDAPNTAKLIEFDDTDETKKICSELAIVQAKLLEIAEEQRNGTRKVKFPNAKRYGRISRKDLNATSDNGQPYWTSVFSTDDIPYIIKEPKTVPLTLREYLRLCDIYYKSNPDRFKDLPDNPKEAFLGNSDMRTRCLVEVDMDDPQDFRDWTDSTGRWKGRKDKTLGHSFEMAINTFMQPVYTDGLNGYFVWDHFIWRYYEAAKLMREPNVLLVSREYLADIINEKDMLKVTPAFEKYGFPNEEFSQPIMYEDLNAKQKRKVVWNELVEAQVKHA